MEKKGYHEPIKASLEEILKRKAQIADCFESAVDAFQDRLQQKIRSYCDINNATKRGKCYVH